MKIVLLLIVALVANASAQCDTDELLECLTDWQDAAATLGTNFFDLQTQVCNLIGDLLTCAIPACPILTEQEGFQQAIDAVATSCGMIVSGVDSNLKYCALFGDPHVRTLDGTFMDCDLTDDEVVFSDGVNSITVVADGEVTWPNDKLTAVRSVTIANTRSGNDYTFTSNPAGNTGFGTVDENDIQVRSNSVYDTVTGMRVRVAAFRNTAEDQAWINVYIRTSSTDSTGICSASTCTFTGDAAKKKNAVRAAACDDLDGEFQEKCEIDVAQDPDFSASVHDASKDNRLYDAETFATMTSVSMVFLGAVLCIALAL